MSGERILVVDDEAGMLHGVKRVLSPRYLVKTTHTPVNALEIAPGFRPDLAILDVRMPEIDGFQLMTRLREIVPGIDVIFMTGAVHELDAQLIRALRQRAFYFIQKPFDREVLLTLVERCLELRRLSAENVAHISRLEAELNAARLFQRGMMPAEDELFGKLRVTARYRPCEALGGDFYDHVDAGNGRVSVLLCDVSGHGVSAAMLTAVVKSAFHDAHTEDYEPGAIVRRVARAIRPFRDDSFVTLLCARADPGGVVEYVNAGHPPAFVWGPDRDRQELTLTGPLVSPAFADLGWEQARCELTVGDRLLVYTDGLIEARRGDDFYGSKRLFDVAAQCRLEGLSFLDQVFLSVDEFTRGAPPDDDRTLLALALEA